MSGDIVSCHAAGGYCHSVGRGQGAPVHRNKGSSGPECQQGRGGERHSQTSARDLGVPGKTDGITYLCCLDPSRPRLNGGFKRGS